MRLGAAIAYYSVFSAAPLLIIAIAIAARLYKEEAKSYLYAQLNGAMGDKGARALQDMFENLYNRPSSNLATIISLATLVFGAMGVFGELQGALNTIWKVAPKPGRTLITFVKYRFLSFVMVVVVGLLALLSVALTAGLQLVKHLSPDWLPGRPQVWIAANQGITFLILVLLFMVIFKLLPDVVLAWRDVWVGATVTAALFTLGKYLVGLYLNFAGFDSAYGAAGSLVVILVWVYYSSLIVLLGAEFTHAYGLQFGPPAVPRANAELLEI
jgi:membrane protein